jgi:hypothetical protein
MEDLTNKNLALLLIAAIVVSLGATLVSLNQLNLEGISGLATGQVNVSITTNASCNIDSNVSFGSAGQVLVTTTISTNSTNAASGYNDCTSVAACYGMNINNTGNVNVNVTFNATSGGAAFLGTADSDFTYNAYNGTANNQSMRPGCWAGVSLPAGWATVPTTATKICNNLTASDTNDNMAIEYNVTLYPTTPPGTKSTVITVACAQN